MEANRRPGEPDTEESPPELSEREREILVLVATGASNKLIAQRLVISPNTVKVHLRNIFAKIGVSSRTEAALFAIRAGLVAMPAEAGGQLPAEEGAAAALVAPAGLEQPAPPAQPAVPPARARPRWLAWAAGLLLVALAATAGTLAWERVRATPTPPPTSMVPTARPRWQALPGLPTPRSGLAVAVYENALYAIGGQTTEGVSGANERFDPAAGIWTPQRTKPLAVADVGAVVIGGLIYVPGGRLATGAVSSTVEVFDPDDNRWERRADLPQPLSAYAITAFEGRLYVFGGWDGQAYSRAVYVYDPGTDAWEVGADMPAARGSAGAAAAGSLIYVIGGRGDAGDLDTNAAYAPVRANEGQGQWSSRAPLPAPLAGLGVTSIADIVYAVGTGADAEWLAGWSYLPAQDIWRELDPPAATATFGLGIGAVQTRLYVLGGQQDAAPTGQHLSFQAIYTTIFPGVGGE